MKITQKLLLCAAIGAFVIPSTGYAEHGYPPHHGYRQYDGREYGYMQFGEKYGPTLPTNVRNYLDYEHREPCQFYYAVPSNAPRGLDRCKVEEEVPVKQRLYPVVASYTIYFDFDKSTIRKDQYATIDRLMSEMNTYQPLQVTVVGHADAAGDANYNKVLSAKRADAVSKELTKRNIANFFLDEEARGEDDLAVPTPDGVKMAENRRVVIQFRR